MAGRYAPHLEGIARRREWMLEQTLSWSQINSGSRNTAGVTAMAAALEAAAEPLGVTVERLQPKPLEEVDLTGRQSELPLGPVLRLSRSRPGARVRVLLAGHLDTVFPADHPFQTPRWLDDNTVNGPGVTDLKGGLAVMLTALEALEASPWGQGVDWQILLNPDEEIGSPGSAPFLAEAARERDIGLVFEPALADGTLAGGRKGSGNWTAVVRGRAAHAGREHHLGRNAVVALAGFVTALDGLNGQRQGVT
ncbi:MAG: M20/M25/M40 family metallo-hydrolase, partial [Candidatus Competibacteraceae bacterium]|nr:M20/M25/M40 family metallo-hydrolase [Candidatus Competibacteraceae bacterium]